MNRASSSQTRIKLVCWLFVTCFQTRKRTRGVSDRTPTTRLVLPAPRATGHWFENTALRPTTEQFPLFPNDLGCRHELPKLANNHRDSEHFLLAALATCQGIFRFFGLTGVIKLNALRQPNLINSSHALHVSGLLPYRNIGARAVRPIGCPAAIGQILRPKPEQEGSPLRVPCFGPPRDAAE